MFRWKIFDRSLFSRAKVSFGYIVEIAESGIMHHASGIFIVAKTQIKRICYRSLGKL
jgi:hypothetical protein